MGRGTAGVTFACVLALGGLHACGDTDDDTRKPPDASLGGSAGVATEASVEAEASSGGSAGTPADSGCDVPDVTEAAACQSYAEVVCSLYEECTPVFLDQLGFGSKAVCVERLVLMCHSQLAGPGVLLQPGTYQLATEALKSVTCADLAMGWYAFAQSTWFVEPECAYWGTLGAGEACHATSQCTRGLRCDVANNELCGVCVPTTLGSECQTDADCDLDLFCSSDDHCQPRKGLGEACTEFTLPPPFIAKRECVENAYCLASVCVPRVGAGSPCTNDSACGANLVCGANGECKPPSLSELGASCSPDEWLSCNVWKGLRCDPALGCQPRLVPAPGEPCGLFSTDGGSGGELYCTGGASCVYPSGVNPGVCMVPAAEGQACDSLTGPACRYPAECVLGVCAIADETTCAAD